MGNLRNREQMKSLTEDQMGIETKLTDELRRIAEAGGGILKPELVVEAAMPEDSILHDRFEWDDGVAGHQHRLWQARQLISVMVEKVKQTEERVYVSLKSDRALPGGGYRLMVDVMSDEELRQQLLQEALDDAELFRKKYARLQELAGVFAAIDEAAQKLAGEDVRGKD